MPKTKSNHSDLLKPSDTKFDRIIRRVEEVAFTLIILTMIVIGIIPVFLRYTGMHGISWTESLSQNMVLWIAFLGAGTAIRERSSISIDAAPHLLSVPKRIFLRGITELISAVVCGVLAWVSIAFVKDAIEFDGDTIAFFNIKGWVLTLALPIGFVMLSLRLFIAAIEDWIRSFSVAKQLKNERESATESSGNEEGPAEVSQK